MAMSAIWIRHNMLGTVEQVQERQLSEAELRVQRSLQKLSIPDWYLNKQSNPPKILSNVTPIECRPPSWKNPEFKRPSNIDSTCKQFADSRTVTRNDENNANNAIDTGTYKISRHLKLSIANRGSRRSPPRVKRIQKEETMDTGIPKVNLPTHISKTFPKVSPSRKIQNINIVFPPGPRVDISSVQESDSADTKFKTFVVKKQIPVCEKPREEENNADKDDEHICCTPTKNYANYSFRSYSPDSCDVSLRTGNVECSFTVRAVSTPKRGSVDLFTSAIIEEIPKMRRLPSQIVAKKTIIEDSPKKCSPPSNYLNRTIIAETPRSKKSLASPEPPNAATPRKISSANLILANRIRSLEPILIEKDNMTVPQSPRKSWIAVKEIVKKFDPKTKSRKHHPVPETYMENASPCTKFFYSKKKSTELENIVQNTQSTRGKGLVRGIIEELHEKVKTSSLLRQSRLNLSNQNYVKTVVSALEKGDTLKAKKVVLDRSRSMLEEDMESYIESDAKSGTFSTSVSIKDTDSSSDYDQRTPTLRSDDESRFDYSILATKQTLLESRAKGCQTDEEDSVYWIPVTRCKLPRTSSLLSVISRLPVNAHHQSPCVSPIKSDSDSSECAYPTAWDATYKKSTITKKLFRIDETAVTDSGYSDKSNNNGHISKASMTDDAWSEETQNDDSGSDCTPARVKKSSYRRKTMVGLKSILV